jgi:hypothetical protein
MLLTILGPAVAQVLPGEASPGVAPESVVAFAHSPMGEDPQTPLAVTQWLCLVPGFLPVSAKLKPETGVNVVLAAPEHVKPPGPPKTIFCCPV